MNDIIDLESLYEPWYGQELVHKSKAKIKVLKWGRGAGKGICAVFQGINRYIDWMDWQPPQIVKPRLHFATIVPNINSGFQPWLEMKEFIPEEFIEVQNGKLSIIEDEHKIYMIGDCLWEMLSADDPKSLLGRGFDYLWIPEASSLDDYVWHRYIRPMTRRAYRKGEVLIEGVPEGDDTWNEKLFQRGQDLEDKEVESWHFTSFDNPHVDIAEIERDSIDMPDAIYAQQYLAETQGDSDKAFDPEQVSACVGGHLLDEPEPNRSYCIGADLGRKHDWTVFDVVDRERRKVVYHERFTKADWGIQKAKLVDLSQKWNRALVVPDASGVGDPFVQELAQAGIPLKPMVLHSPYEKHKLMAKLQIAIERETIKFPDIPELVRELKQYREYKKTLKGEVARFHRWQAPKGYHDDCVMALALALEGCYVAGGWDNLPKARSYATIRR